jgi:hypothetical protein
MADIGKEAGQIEDEEDETSDGSTEDRNQDAPILQIINTS